MGRMTDHAPRPPRPTPLGRTTGHNHVDRHLQLHWRQRMVRPLMGYCTAIRWKIVDDCVQQQESEPSHTNTHSSHRRSRVGLPGASTTPRTRLVCTEVAVLSVLFQKLSRRFTLDRARALSSLLPAVVPSASNWKGTPPQGLSPTTLSSHSPTRTDWRLWPSH